MVLRNWYNQMKAYRAQTTITNGIATPSGFANAGYYDSNFYESNILGLRPNNGLAFYTNPGSGLYFMVGRGTTPPTLDDSKLESLINSGLSCTVVTSEDEDNDAVYKLGLTNTSSEDITIGEVGIFGSVYTHKNSAATTWALLERTVLGSPITIPAGGLGMIEYCIKIPIPTT